MISNTGEITFAAKVLEVHSGDDVILMVDLGVDSLYKRVRARLAGVDTPDAFKSSGKEAAGKVRDSVRGMVKDKDCLVTVIDARKASWLVTLHIMEGNDPSKCVNLNQHLIAQGYVYGKEDRTG